jgi:hypothetical protein
MSENLKIKFKWFLQNKSWSTLEGLCENDKLPVKTKYWLGKVRTTLMNSAKELDEILPSIKKKYNFDDKTSKYPEGQEVLAQKEWADFLETEIELPINKKLIVEDAKAIEFSILEDIIELDPKVLE